MPSHAVGRCLWQCLPTGTVRSLAAGAQIKKVCWFFDFKSLRNVRLASLKQGRAVILAPKACTFSHRNQERATSSPLSLRHAETTSRIFPGPSCKIHILSQISSKLFPALLPNPLVGSISRGEDWTLPC